MTERLDADPPTHAAAHPKPPPLAVLWDADGVLQELPGGWVAAMSTVLAPALGADRVETFLRDAWQAELPTLTGTGRWTDVLPAVLERWGLAEFHDAILAVWVRLESFPGAVEAVRQVRRSGVRCYLATNQDAHRAGVMHEQFGYGALFDGCFYSWELGAAKPSPAYFAAVLSAVDLPAGRVLFIDDTLRNVEAARSVGLSAQQWTISDGIDRLHTLLADEGLSLQEATRE